MTLTKHRIRKEPSIVMMNKEPQQPTHGIVHAGFSGLRRFVARKKSQCNLIGNRFLIPHDTIPSNVSSNIRPWHDTLVFKTK
jgi:hypothetical protein